MCGLSAHTFGVLIDHLNELLETQKNDLKLLALIKIKIAEAVNLFNKCALIPMFVLMSANVWTLTFGIYEIYNVFANEVKEFRKISYAIMATLGSTHFTILIIIYVIFCNSTTKKGGDFERKLHRMNFMKHPGEKIQAKLKKNYLILLQLEHEGVKFSTGMYDFDWKLLGFVSELIELIN